MKQLNFIIGIQGTIVEHRWRWNLTTLGIERRKQDRIIRKCMTASVEGMQRVLRAETPGGDGEGSRSEDGGQEEVGRIYILCNILTHAHTQRKRAAVTPLGHLRKRRQMGTPMSLS